MTAYSGANLRTTDAYWELSGPLPNTTPKTCRACRGTILKGTSVFVRDGRKLRFFYHEACFTGDADPRTQDNSSFEERQDYHTKLAPNVSALEGLRAVKDADGRVLGRAVFKPEAPRVLGAGKWSVAERGYRPNGVTAGPTSTSRTVSSTTSSPVRLTKSIDRKQSQARITGNGTDK